MSRPFPEIARFPGEAKLEGVPHLRKDSIFSQDGVVDALEIIDSTVFLNSAQRRPHIDRAVQHLLKNPDTGPSVLSALEMLHVQEIIVNPERRRHASFLLNVLSPKIACSQETRNEVVAVEEDIADEMHDYLIDWNNVSSPNENKRSMRKDKFLQLEVGKRVAIGEVNTKENVELGIKLANKYFDPEEDIPATLQTFIDLAHCVDAAKVKATTRGHTTEVSNAIITGITATFGKRMPCDSETLRIITDTVELFKEKSHLGWSAVKAATLAEILRQRKDLHSYMNQMKPINKVLEIVDIADVNELSDAASTAMAKLLTLRKYGIKSAYFRDGIMHCPQDSWVIQDPEEYYEAVADNYRLHLPEIATISLAHATEITKIKGEANTEIYGRGRQTRITLDYGNHFSLGLMPDGELVISGTQGATPIKQDFDKQGLSAVYEYLRLSHINRLIDLTVPVEMLRELPSLSKGESVFSRFRNLRKLTKPQKLLLPRLNFIDENFEEIKVALEKEVREAEARSLREHIVVGHRRILPEGYKPSPEAKKEAALQGILLADNETWVTKHKRGDDKNGKIESHQAIR